MLVGSRPTRSISKLISICSCERAPFCPILFVLSTPPLGCCKSTHLFYGSCSASGRVSLITVHVVSFLCVRIAQSLVRLPSLAEFICTGSLAYCQHALGQECNACNSAKFPYNKERTHLRVGNLFCSTASPRDAAVRAVFNCSYAVTHGATCCLSVLQGVLR